MSFSHMLSTFSEKAQSTINSRRAAHNTPDSSAQAAASPSGNKSHTFETLAYHLRALGQQYSYVMLSPECLSLMLDRW